MAHEDDKKISLDSFLGLYARGQPDEVPQDHARDCQNVTFNIGQVGSREGVLRNMALAKDARRFFLSTMDDGNLHLLVLDSDSNIRVDGTGTALLAAAGMTDFVGLNMFNRTYISALSGASPLPGTNLKMWDGSTIRDAAGLAPVGSALVGAESAGGDVNIGVHKIAVAYITDSGFVTQPGPKITGVFTSTPVTVTVDSANKIDISNIPIGPPGTIQRQILVTKADEEEFFFISGGLINDNITTTVSINFFDTDLVISADYLFDLLEVIPTFNSMTKYHGRLVGVWEPGNIVYLSRPGEPESISSVDGYITVPSERDGNGPVASFPLSDTLYITKLVGMFSTVDTGGPPSTWPLTLVDGAIGAYHYGISSFTAAQPAFDTSNSVILASVGGCYLFDGIVRRPELSWKINDIWARINFNNFYKVTVAHDIWRHRIYINMPLDDHVDPNRVFVIDYSEGFDNIALALPDHKKVKWAPWKFHRNPTCIGMAYLPFDGKFELRIGSIDADSGFIWGLDPDTIEDDCNEIDAYYELSLIGLDGFVTTYSALRFRVSGTGNFLIRCRGLDNIPTQTLLSLPLSIAPGHTLFRKMNLVTEKMSVKFGTDAGCNKWIVQNLDIFAAPLWQVRPG